TERIKIEYGRTVCYSNSVCNCSPLILKGLKENMAIEKLKEKGIIVAYRSNVYYKGKQNTGTRRQSKKEAELDELEKKRDLLTCNHLKESQKRLDDRCDDYLTLVAPKRLGLSALQSAESYYKKHTQPGFGFREMARIKSTEVQKSRVQK